MKTRTLPNNKLILLGAFLAAIVFPYAAGAVTSTTSSDQQVSFTISKAIEVVNPSGSISLGTTAPVVGSSSFTRELTGSGSVTGGHRTNASGNLSIVRTGDASGINGVLQVQDSGSTFQPLTTKDSTTVAVASLTNNTNNNLQAATSASFKLPISWADAAGSSNFTVRTIAGNGA